MSYPPSEEVISLTKQLVAQLTNFKANTKAFKKSEKYAVTQFQNAGTMYFNNRKDIQLQIESLSDKFSFHGYWNEAKDLKMLFDKFVDPVLQKDDMNVRLNVVKFLVCISESPTNNFHNYPRHFDRGDVEEVIDWPAYLQEGIARWSPPPDDDSSDWSDDSGSYLSASEQNQSDSNLNCSLILAPQVLKSVTEESEDGCDYRKSVMENIQSGWFIQSEVKMRPHSRLTDANIAILWDDFVKQTTGGLLTLNTNIVSEYKIIREVLWQFYGPHLSFCFNFVGDKLLPKPGVSIASVRGEAFYTFMHEFQPYIDALQVLRNFHDSLNSIGDDEVSAPHTYKTYDFALQSVIEPVFDTLREIEETVRTQEKTMTLIKLAQILRPIFKPIMALKRIHERVVKDFKTHSPLECASSLLVDLHRGLPHICTKLEQDLYLTLYLGSLYKYFTIIDVWLSRDVLEDYAGEFVILDGNPKVLSCFPAKNVSLNVSKIQEGEQDWQMEFIIRELPENCLSDGIIAIICSQVLQVGRNIHLLRLLGRLHLLSDTSDETLHKEFVRKVLEEIHFYFNSEEIIREDPEILPDIITSTGNTFKFPATCVEEFDRPTEMDRLENLINSSDGFLINAFETFFVEKEAQDKPKRDDNLFKRISDLTQKMFPVQRILEDTFVGILKERYRLSGLTVKNLLVNEYQLKKHFSLLKHIFLFHDDLIFPFYRKMFEQFDTTGKWGNDILLTSHLHDLIIDVYPELYEKCHVEVKDNWMLCSEPLKACEMVNMNFRIKWPLNIIIREEHTQKYRVLFEFILKIKWALYTLNHLYFSDIEPKKRMSQKQPNKAFKVLVSRLKILRFCLLNDFSRIQHYILGHAYNKFSGQFDRDFENASDLETVMKAHSDFIQAVYDECTAFKEYKSSSYGLDVLLQIVRRLRIMWKNLKEVEDKHLDKCEAAYRTCHKNIDTIVNPSEFDMFVK